jgi:glutamine synthetase
MDLKKLKREVERGEIDTVIVVFPDVFGRLMGKRFTGRFFLDHVAKNGTHSCNYLLTVNMEMDPLEGFEVANWEKGFGDFEMRPDLSSLRGIPWQTGAALVICDYARHDHELVQEAPRSVLQQELAKLRHKKWSCYIASELEFFLFNNSFHEAYQADYRNLRPSSDYRIDYHTMQPARDEAIMKEVRNGMAQAGIGIESSKGEWGKGQYEINFIYNEPLIMADNHVIFKQGLKEIAAQHGKSVTFMPKLAAHEVGSSCHIHVSLWKDGKNLFWDPKTKGSTLLFRQFLGGLIKYSPELCCFLAPTINSYKRYQSASWAPTKMAWANDNRTVGFRVVGKENSFRIENRMPGADANPYLAFAATLAAGMAGVEEKLDCGELYEGNAYLDPTLESLPKTLAAAAELLDRSQFARSAFGDAVVDFYAHTARLEVQAFNDAVTDWERARYFERI